MSHTRKWFYILEAEGEQPLEHGTEEITQYVGQFTCIDEASIYLADHGVEWARGCPGFSRFSLGKQKVNDPESYQFVMSLDVDGDQVEIGWKKVQE